jgi:1,4-alpha-glucan branching enzyme
MAVERDGESTVMRRIHPDGIFEAEFPDATGTFAYRLRASTNGERRTFDDPYRFPPALDESRIDRFRSGEELRAHTIFGARPARLEDVEGIRFAVWAPRADNVSLIGDFNDWDARAHPMRPRARTGVWELFVPGMELGQLYKYAVHTPTGITLDKTDPYGFRMEVRPDTASVVWDLSLYEWGDGQWMRDRDERQAATAPTTIYEVHLGSWRRHGASSDEPDSWLGYRALADQLLPYVKELGFTHIELMPITEHPLDKSWGYQTVGYFAPTSRFGPPDDFRHFIDRAHELDIGVILDWVPAHFPRDAHGLAMFDGSHLYEHSDPRKGAHPDWGTSIYDYARPEVRSFLISSALFWLDQYHIDGIRIDAVASMLYLDYSRGPGEWLPNVYGGRENLEAVEFIRDLTDAIHDAHPDVLVIAEESTAWPGVTRPTDEDGLGFDIKWNMGWMHDTLRVLESDPLFRKGHYESLTFSILYAFSERFLLPLSHDEVVYLKQSLLSKMPGTADQKLANMRLLLAYMWAHPGKKLLFMGGEFGQEKEWDFESELEWSLLDEPGHRGLQRMVRELNRVYTAEPAFHESDFDPAGFEWIDCHDASRTTLAFIRWTPGWRDFVIVVANFTPVEWTDYRLGLPYDGEYEVILSSDAAEFGGPVDLEPTAGRIIAEDTPHVGRPYSIELPLPPLSVLYLKRTERPSRDEVGESEHVALKAQRDERALRSEVEEIEGIEDS